MVDFFDKWQEARRKRTQSTIRSIGVDKMPLDPYKLREASEKAVNLSTRFDAFMERRRADSEDDEDEDEDVDLDP
jgi:hypothetical protein